MSTQEHHKMLPIHSFSGLWATWDTLILLYQTWQLSIWPWPTKLTRLLTWVSTQMSLQIHINLLFPSSPCLTSLTVNHSLWTSPDNSWSIKMTLDSSKLPTLTTVTLLSALLDKIDWLKLPQLLFLHLLKWTLLTLITMFKKPSAIWDNKLEMEHLVEIKLLFLLLKLSKFIKEHTCKVSLLPFNLA